MTGDLAPDTAFTVEHATALLAEACATAGLDADDATLIRLGENAVFRLTGPVVVRVARSATSKDSVERSVQVAKWLAEVAYPAARLLPGLPQPVSAAGQSVTFWQAVATEERFVSTKQLGQLLARLHTLNVPQAPRLPKLDPLADAFRRLRTLSSLSRTDLTFLTTRAAELQAHYAELKFALPPAVLHGDAHVGNGLLDAHGHPVLIDLDGFAIGPREWDLVVPALNVDRLGWHTEAEYEAFVRAYGFDVMTWYGYPVLADIRELDMVVWLAQNAGHSPDIASEVAQRIGDLRTGSDRRHWHAF
ncbi:phosphotransferase enzyme family protein [Yinghuangia sp. YIM S09857]|uniref:phosphotransferase enzyme family protein n=1 Tax=Yinghuangia sp. YIM S09857 TaxID=3436929 RepID=UPI003F52A1B6